MSKLKLQVPIGTGDYLPDECFEKRRLEEIFRKNFKACGYREIETPSFEYYDVFMHDAVPYVQENMIKFFDLKGRILALRPDMTGPIARMAATKLPAQSEVLRMCCIGNVFGHTSQGRMERTQAGVELIGKAGAAADAEVISVAIQSLISAGLSGFKIDIGQVAFFKGLVAPAALSEEEREKIRAMIDAKNNVELEYELSRMEIDADVKRSLLELPNLFGGEEVFAAAEQFAKNDTCRFALQNIREVYGTLKDYGYGEYISIDLGLLNNFNYYSGILFRGMADGIGVPILSGGRYDGLVSEFGADAAATGFAIGIKELLIVLEAQGRLVGDSGKVKVVRCAPERRGEGYGYAKELRARGESVIMETNGAAYDAARYDVIDFV